MIERGDGLEAIEPFLGELLESVAPGQRMKLMDKLMRFARRANAARISANQEPDGAAMAPRKRRPKGKRAKMFKNIGRQRSLKIRVSADEGELAFANPLIADTAGIHHFGRVGYVGKTRGGKVIRTKYDARRLLGFGREQDEFVEEVLRHMGG